MIVTYIPNEGQPFTLCGNDQNYTCIKVGRTKVFCTDSFLIETVVPLENCRPPKSKEELETVEAIKAFLLGMEFSPGLNYAQIVPHIAKAIVYSGYGKIPSDTKKEE